MSEIQKYFSNLDFGIYLEFVRLRQLADSRLEFVISALRAAVLIPKVRTLFCRVP